MLINALIVGIHFKSVFKKKKIIKICLGGPIWKAPINNFEFIKMALADLKNPKFPSSYILHKNDFSNLFEAILEVNQII